jgi:hypothetical protein
MIHLTTHLHYNYERLRMESQHHPAATTCNNRSSSSNINSNYSHSTTPPSLQTRVGVVFHSSMANGPHRHPSLAANASRRGYFFCSTTTTPPSLQTRAGGVIYFILQPSPPLPRCKRESEGISTHLRQIGHTATPPSLQTRAGGVIYFVLQPPPLPRCKREPEWVIYFVLPPPPPLPRCKRESEGISTHLRQTGPLPPLPRCKHELGVYFFVF